jgi:hypothetical protein
MTGRRVAGLCLIAAAFAACGPIAPLPGNNGTLPGDFDVHVANGTTLQVSIIVNGALVRAIAPGGDTIAATTLPALPWNVEVRSASGRLLTSVQIGSDSVRRQGNSITSTGARVDLSCGRLDIYIAVPIMGPAPGPGVPGDCEP